MLAFFLYVFCFNVSANSFSEAIKIAKDAKIDAEVRWSILLHAHKNVQIADPEFLLSSGDFSASNELNQTIKSFYSLENLNTDEHPICKFPARYAYIKNKILTVDPTFELPKSKCPSLNQYLDYVPFERVDLVFASSDINSATSMMGHVFLKAQGTSSRGNFVEHGLSFFNDVTSYNPFVLGYDAFVAGMPGYFIVKPYDVMANRYVNKEKRNLWAYELKADKFNLHLLKLHLWELKEVDINYLFHSYNCATLTLYITGLIEPKVLEGEVLWVSPLDVVKATISSGITGQHSVETSSDWKHSNLPLNRPESYRQDSSVRAAYYLHSATAKSPSQEIEVSFLPASHRINYDNRLIGYESELKMFDTSVSLQDNDNNGSIDKVFLSNFDLYSVTSFAIKNSDWFNANHFSLGVNSVFDPNKLEFVNYGDVTYAIGQSYRTDLLTTYYAMLEFTAATNLKDAYFAIKPTIGFSHYLAEFGKFNLKYQFIRGEIEQSFEAHNLGITYSYFLSNELVISLDTNYKKTKNYNHLKLGASIDVLF